MNREVMQQIDSIGDIADAMRTKATNNVLIKSTTVDAFAHEITKVEEALRQVLAAHVVAAQPHELEAFVQIGMFTNKVERARCIWWDGDMQPEGTAIYIRATLAAAPAAPPSLPVHSNEDYQKG